MVVVRKGGTCRPAYAHATVIPVMAYVVAR